MGEPATAEGYVEVPGGRVWYRITGADRPGIPVLCLHGGPGMPHDYLEPLADLASRRPVIFYDQLGCGRSDRQIVGSVFHLADREPYRRLNDAVCVCVGKVRAASCPARPGLR